jgi:hypothetical protein
MRQIARRLREIGREDCQIASRLERLWEHQFYRLVSGANRQASPNRSVFQNHAWLAGQV